MDDNLEALREQLSTFDENRARAGLPELVEEFPVPLKPFAVILGRTLNHSGHRATSRLIIWNALMHLHEAQPELFGPDQVAELERYVQPGNMLTGNALYNEMLVYLRDTHRELAAF